MPPSRKGNCTKCCLISPNNHRCGLGLISSLWWQIVMVELFGGMRYVCLKTPFSPSAPSTWQPTACFHHQAYGEITGPAPPPRSAVKWTLSGEVKSPAAGGLWHRTNQQLCRDGGGELGGVRGKKGTSPALTLAKRSQFNNLWLRVCPLPSERVAPPHWSAEDLTLVGKQEGLSRPSKVSCQGGTADFKCTRPGRSASTAPRSRGSIQGGYSHARSPQPPGTHAGRRAMPEKFCELLHHSEQL